VATPGPVRIALALLWLVLAVSVAASLAYYASSGLPLGFADVGSHVLSYLLMVLLLLGIGAGNAWARILFVVFLGWKLALAAFNLLLQSTQLPWLYGLDLALLLVQCGAAALLFRAASNDWFRRGA
jgi:hypothetical protein